MTETAKQLDYSERKYIAPKYKLSKLVPKAGGGAATITAAGGNDFEFEIPIKAFNSAQSFLEFSCNIPLGASCNYVYADTMPFFQRIVLSTQSGVELLNIPDASNYFGIVWNPETDLQKFLTFPIHESKADTVANSPPNLVGAGSLFMRSNVAAANRQPPVGVLSTLAYTDPRYVIIGGNAAETSFNVRLPLDLIYNTVLELDKTMYYGQILNLRFVFQPKTRIAFNATDANPIAAIVASADIAVSNINLQLAIEQDQAIVSQLISNYQKGFSMTVPYVHVIRNSSVAATSSNITLKISRLHGRRLKRLYHSLFNTAMTLSTSFDNSNFAGATNKVTSYWTLMDQVREQETDVNCLNLDDYRLVKPYIHKSVIQDFKMYQYKWFHMSDYHGIVEVDKENKENLVGGLSLDTEKTWQILLTTANAAYNHFTILVVEKLLTVGPGDGAGVSIN